MKYSMTCEMDHEPMTMTVEAENDDEAMEKMMEQSKTHFADKHPDMTGKSDDEIKEMITSMWTKEEGEAPVEEGAA